MNDDEPSAITPLLENSSMAMHSHRCHLCWNRFDCTRENCQFEDKYAVCQRPACIAEWEAE